MERHWWVSASGNTLWLDTASFDEGEDTLEFWKWRREQPDRVSRVCGETTGTDCPISVEDADFFIGNTTKQDGTAAVQNNG
jgi:hypothetical protein